MNIFPNPAEGRVNISGIIPGTLLTVTDLQGKSLMEKIADSDNTEFDLNGLSIGGLFCQNLTKWKKHFQEDCFEINGGFHARF